MKSKIGIIIGREFSERVRKKSFIITTLLMPLFMLALMVAPALIMMFAGGDERTVGVIDESGFVAQNLNSDSETTFLPLTGTTLDEALACDTLSAVLYIPAGAEENNIGVKLFTNGASSMSLESNITSQVNSIIEDQRLRSYNIENLSSIMDKVHSDVKLQSIRNDREEGDNQSSTTLSYVLGIVLTFLLYMCLLLYGQMVMTSIIEEKNNRVLEIVVSSVKPTQLMLGKICGIGLVAVTQILIWGIILTACSIWLMPLVSGAAQGAGGFDLGALGSPAYILELFGYITLFLIGGYLFYSSIYDDSIPRARVPHLLIYFCRHRISGRQHPGRIPTCEHSRHSYHNRHGSEYVRGTEPGIFTGRLDIDDSFHFPDGDDGAHTVRHTGLADMDIFGFAVRLFCRHGMALGKNIPGGHIHVWKETEFLRTYTMGTIQIGQLIK